METYAQSAGRSRPGRTGARPGGGSPDMGGITPDGKVIWLSGRYNGVVYAISAKTGA